MPTTDPRSQPQFDLGEFRHAAAALVRFMMRAREKAQPGSLQQHYSEWDLTSFANERLSCEQLLKRALIQIREIDAKFLGPRDSGGLQFDENDSLQEFKSQIAFFVDQFDELPRAILACKRDEPINWECLANWSDLSTIRAALNQLPQPAQRTEQQDLVQTVTLRQAAASVHRSKRTLEGYKTEMPRPLIKGGKGQPAEYAWSELRPWLEKQFKHHLPEHFPASRFLD